MASYNFSSSKCSELVESVEYRNYQISSSEDIMQLASGCRALRNEEIGDMYGRPMLLIGIYISVASFLCVLAMAADLVHGFRNRKLWIPCKYFTLNSAYITVIAVAMKLPVDLTTPMLAPVDEGAKVVSLAFMATMMVNIMPSLASMDNKTLVANVIAIPACREIIDSKYQAKNKDLIDESRQPAIKDAVKIYWIMAETSNPQFVMSNNPLCGTCGVLCLLLMSTNVLLGYAYLRNYTPLYVINVIDLTQSPYKWSTFAVYLTQFAGILVGTCPPMFRWVSLYEFKSGAIRNKILRLFRVEDYWTRKLHEWKQHRMQFPSSSRGFRREFRRLINNPKDVFLYLLILIQIVVVFFCKLVSALLPQLMGRLGVFLSAWGRNFSDRLRLWLIVWWFKLPITSSPRLDPYLDKYFLKTDDELEIAEFIRDEIFTSMNSYILKAEKEENEYLLELMEQSTGFEGVKTFDTNRVQPLLPHFEAVNSWSLPIVTLTCIALALPNMHKQIVKNLFEGVNEGLSYTHLVEESFNCGNKYAKLQKVSKTLWKEVDNKSKWLGIPLPNDVFTGRAAATQTVKWFSEKASEILRKYDGTNQRTIESMDDCLIVATSMYRISKTILYRYQNNSEPVTGSDLFVDLKVMIADIFNACFTNLPRVIRMKCCEIVIEKREANVKVAAELLGKTTEIRRILEARQLPLMDVDKRAYIDEWRNQPFP